MDQIATKYMAQQSGNAFELRLLDPSAHAEELYFCTHSVPEENVKLWAFLPVGPFESLISFRSWLASLTQTSSSAHFCVFEKATNKPVGIVSLIDFDKSHLTIEITNLLLCRRAQKAGASYETAMLLL